MDAPVLASLVTGCIGLVVLLVQHGFYANRQAAQRRKHELELEEVKRQNAEQLADRARLGDEAASHREARRLSLDRLWSAMSIANSAADAMVKSSSTRDIEILVERTAKFIQELTPLLNEVKAASHNLSLAKTDVQSAIEVRNEAVRLFLALDPDSGPKAEYQRRLADGKAALDKCLSNFKVQVEHSRVPKQ